MPQKPLLFFPTKEIATRSKLGGGGGRYFSPSSTRQYTRLNPQFQALNDALNSQRISIQQTTIGVEPEQVLVFETIGSVEDFANAVHKIEGFEWLGEIEIDEIIPDMDFYQLNKEGERTDKLLSGRLYLISTNCHAMEQLLSLWNSYTQNESIKFERGKGKFKDVFRLLKNIRKWDIEDRFEESKILSFWEENLQIDPTRIIRFEIELWYRNNLYLRQQSYNTIQHLLVNLGGRIISSCDISNIVYQSVLAELPANEIRNILENRNTALVKCENIMFFKPSGQIAIVDSYDTIGELIEGFDDAPLPSGDPVVAILDGYPLTGHRKLTGRLIVEDNDNLQSYYQVEDRKHGTAMCSLIIRGDLNTNNDPISTPLYVCPIMRPNERDRNRREFIPDDSLLVDTIHRAIRQMFDGENGSLPTAPSVKLINLSIGDSDRPFYHSMSPLGKLLDWLSYKYNVLFIVSSGNHSYNICTQMPKIDFEALIQIDREKIILKSILADSRNRRIISPAESINSITVGALHNDNSSFYSNEQRLNPYSCLLPSPYTALGSGYRKSIKPDLVFDGGRQMFDFSLRDGTMLNPANFNSPPGHKVASPDNTLIKTVHSIGTSNSAALMSRNGHFCYEILHNLFLENNIIPINISILIKAMLAHGCSWDNIGDDIERRLDLSDWRVIKNAKNKFIGYGLPNIDKVRECTEQRATIIGFGELKEEEAHVYSLPLPPSLASQTIKRRLTITLAWFSPISPNTQKYRTSRLWFEAKNKIASSRLDSDDKAVKRGTLQHEVFEGSNATAYIDGDSIQIKVNCSKDAADYPIAIPYALIVTLEVAENIDLQIYQEIRDRISIPIQVGQHL